MRTYVTLEALRDRVIEHIIKCGNPVNIVNHDRTEKYTVRTPHAARQAGCHQESAGSHSASVPAKTRVLPPSDPSDTLF